MGGFKITGLAAGVAATDSVNKGQIDSAVPPVGAIMDYAGATAPAGWFLCYGQAVSRSSYPDLFAAIGTTYGIGNGTTTFNIPDCRGRVRAGKDNMGGSSANRLTNQTGGVNGGVLGAVGGAETHTLTTAQLASHTHTGTTASDGSHTHTTNGVGATGGNVSVAVWGSGNRNDGSRSMSTDGAHTHAFTSNSSGSDAAHNNVQPAIIFNTIIRSGA